MPVATSPPPCHHTHHHFVSPPTLFGIHVVRVHTGDIYHVSWANLEGAEVKNATIEACFVAGVTGGVGNEAGGGGDTAEASPSPSSTLLEIMWINGSSTFLIVNAGSDLPSLPEGWVVTTLAELEETKRLKRLPPPDIETEPGHEGAPAKKIKTDSAMVVMESSVPSC